MDTSSTPPDNLPFAGTPFIGRQAELHQLTTLLQTARLLTLTGPGGSGKSRLALQLATQQQHLYANGICWCDLAPLSDPANVPQAVAASLHIAEEPAIAISESLVRALRQRQLLLILDNCEHLLAACAALASRLHRDCPQLTLLATSLQPLGLPAEIVWPVPPLALPDISTPATLANCDAVQLFLDRARRVQPGFDPTSAELGQIAAICRRLDGLPLAIELAAARARLLTPAQITTRLDDTFQLLTRGTTSPLPRHQTLQAAMDWSYQLLTAPQQALLRHLAVFGSGFNLAAAEAVFGQPNVLDLLADLVDRSLVLVTTPAGEQEATYRLLELIRQYAQARLAQAGEAPAARTRLLTWCVALAEEAAPALTRPGREQWLARLTANQLNFRAALRWVRISRQISLGMRLVSALWRFWLLRGQWAEGRSWCDELLALAAPAGQTPTAEPIPTLLLARINYCAGVFAYRQEDLAAANNYAQHSLALLDPAGAPGQLAATQNLLATIADDLGDFDQAATRFAEALALNRAQQDHYGISTSLTNLGRLARNRGDYALAHRCYQESLEISQTWLHEPPATELYNLGDLAALQGDYAAAAALIHQSQAIAEETGDTFLQSLILMRLTDIARNQFDTPRAAEYAQASFHLQQALGVPIDLAYAHIALGDVARDQQDWALARQQYQTALALLQPLNYPRGSGHALNGLGLVAAANGQDEAAADCFRRSLAQFRLGQRPLDLLAVLENLAQVLSRPGDAPLAARCLAVATAQRAQLGAPIPAVDRTRCAATRQHLASSLGRAELAALEAQAAQAGPQALWVLVAAILGETAEAGTAPEVDRSPAGLLHVAALGPAQVIVAGRLLATADWTYTKSRELFFFLLTHPPASKAQIGLELWPDASAKQLRRIFHRAMYYLRQALGHPAWIVFTGGQYTVQPPDGFWFDLANFEHLLQQAARLTRPGNPTARDRQQAITLLEEAVRLWRGDFLADMDGGGWLLLHREEMHRQCVKALLNLGQLYLAGAAYESAASVYRRILAEDEYLEPAHRELMRCYARQGDVSQALAHYERLRHLLHTELAAEPSAETRLLAQRLRRGDDI